MDPNMDSPWAMETNCEDLEENIFNYFESNMTIKEASGGNELFSSRVESRR
jgi:hypothetical protein